MNKIEKIEETLTISEFLALVWENRKFVLIITGIFIVLSVIYAVTLPKVYQASVTFIEDKTNQESVASLSKLLGTGSFNSGTTGEEIDKNMIVLKSRKLKDKVIDAYDLKTFYEKDIKREKTDLEKRYVIYEKIDKIVSVTKNEKSGLYTITAVMKDKNMVVVMANGYFNEFQRFIENESSSQKRGKLLYLKQNIDTVEQDIKNKENELRNVEKKYNTASLDEDAKIVIAQMSELKKKIMSLNSELNTAVELSGTKSFEVEKIKKDIIEANRQLKELQTGSSKTLNLISLGDITDIKTTVEKIKRELDANKSVYDLMRTEYEALKLEIVKENSKITLIDDAILPRREKSTRKVVVLMGVILGFMISIITVMVVPSELRKKYIKI